MIRSLSLAAGLLFACSSQAAVIMGNLASTTPGDPLLFGSTTSINPSQAKAAVFSVDQSLRLEQVFLGLSNFNNDDTFDIFIGSLSGNSITSLQALELLAPTRTADNSARVWEFGPTGGDLLLDPGTDYALTLTASVGSYTWGRVGNDPVTPTGLATFGGYYFSTDSGTTFASSTDPNLTNSFTIIGAEVPVPAPALLLMLAMLPLLRMVRRRR